MLVELGLVEQRYKAVLEVLDGAVSVTDVARRYGVGRQTVHTWLRRYATERLPGLADRSSRPHACPHQMTPEVEARVLEMRRLHPGWGPRTILSRLVRADVTPLPSRLARSNIPGIPRRCSCGSHSENVRRSPASVAVRCIVPAASSTQQ